MSKRQYTNREIQEKLSLIIRTLPMEEIEKLCRKDYSKLIFDNNFPLLLKVSSDYTYSEKMAAVKDESGMNRWTWKFEFQKGGYAFAITTQWYPRNDEYVQKWLRKHSE